MLWKGKANSRCGRKKDANGPGETEDGKRAGDKDDSESRSREKSLNTQTGESGKEAAGNTDDQRKSETKASITGNGTVLGT